MITIIDYDAGNLMSAAKAIEYLGEKVQITGDPDVIAKADKLILPGVGAFGDAMKLLDERGIVPAIKDAAGRGIPLLGICLGLQLLFPTSEESVGAKGISLLDGEIVRIPEKDDLKIPHIGWNSITFPKESTLFRGITEGSYVYFVHSYYLKAKDQGIVAARTNYGTDLDVAVEKDNIYACQFHPEKSGEVGLKILQNFINI